MCLGHSGMWIILFPNYMAKLSLIEKKAVPEESVNITRLSSRHNIPNSGKGQKN